MADPAAPAVNGSFVAEDFMLRMLLCFVMCALLAGGPGCTQHQGDEGEKEVVEAFTEQVGREAAEEIKKPIGKARAIENLAEKHVQEMDAVEASE